VNEAHEINIAERAREDYKAELGSLVPFSDLQILCDYIENKTGVYTSIGIRYNGKLKYTFYQEPFLRTTEFNTVQELQQAMERILNPPVDQGVLIDI